MVSNSPGLVDFAVGLVNSVLNLPYGQVMFFEKFEWQKNCEINSAYQKAFGASWNDVWASKCYKNDFLCTLWNAVTWQYYLYRPGEFTSAVMGATPFAYLTQFIRIRPISFLTSTVNMCSVISLKYVMELTGFASSIDEWSQCHKFWSHFCGKHQKQCNIS